MRLFKERNETVSQRDQLRDAIAKLRNLIDELPSIQPD
jgi:hypothetical protein